MNKVALMIILFGAALWGTIGLFVQALYGLGFSPIEVVTLRVSIAFLALFLYVALVKRSALSMKWKHVPYFLGTGICSIVFFNWAYFTAIQEMNLSIAAVLLYTGPAFVAIMSRIIFKELFTPQKIVALIATFIGCVLVIGLFPVNTGQFSTYGILVGIGSGFGYALYSIFGKAALSNYSSLTITTYTFLFASLALVPTSGLMGKAMEWWSIDALLLSLGLGLIPTVLAYLLYTRGLHFVESSKASIVATVEPVVAALIGVFVFQDLLHFWQIIGIISILSGVVFMNLKTNGKTKINLPEREKLRKKA
ncbi:drug/metabolite transporter (DMT)-like permease [Evansella vedderi]|uniref:Drug/metabolite transporter (DMT)-like permease n=1 Tax=Evansella vedderi TaxID=38282 RepID=A0ABT9ZZ82_9BACI|nr:EamA family transporter [Evansella vedderi]MDQ0256560.1 drug/metabolite transporter (DMT)-like permease [Evansella vedderi]